MVLPSNGAGITIAMIGGRIAGQVISEHIKKGKVCTIMRKFEATNGICDEKLKAFIQIGSTMFRMPDWLLDLFFNRLTKDSLASSNAEECSSISPES